MNNRRFIRFSGHALCLVLFIVSAAAGQAQSFTVSANPQALTVYPGQTSVPITISVASSTYTGPVNVTLSGLPSGITVSPAPLTLTPGSTGTLTLNVGLNADQEAFPAASALDANTALTNVTVVGAVGSSTATSTFSLTVSLTNPGYAPTQSQITLPIVNINTNGVPINDGTTDVPGTITITSADGNTSYLPNAGDTDNTAAFHWHGNTTAEMPKKPYHVKLNTSLDLLNVMGLSCPYVTNTSHKPACDKSKSYILLANYDDKSLLRDWAASALANAIPYGGSYLNETGVPAPNTGVIPTPSGTSTLMPWAPHSLFVELYVNGAYEGNYQLIEQVKVDSHRLNITELTESDTGGSGDDITGGYLMEIDQHRDEAFVFTTPKGLPIGLIDPDFTPDPEIAAQTNYISNYVDTAETALFSSNFTDPTLGWRAYYDEAAAINFYLVNDIMGNEDGGRFYSSTYVYKAIDNPFLYMGPIWDFDISSGNVNYDPIVNPTVPWMQNRALWYKQWFQDPGFKTDVVNQFNTLKNNGVFSSWVSSIASQAAALEQSQANNFARWPMLGIKVWPNPEASGSYDAEVAYLTNYLNLRIAYLDSVFNGKTPTSTSVTAPSGTLYLGSPQTLAAHVTGGQSPTGIVSFFSGGVVVGIASLDGTGTATLTTSNLLLGQNSIGAVYNGDTTNALSSAPTKTVTVVQPLVGTVTSLASSMSNASSGTTVSLNVSVVNNSGSKTPTGNVTFTSNGNAIGTASLTAGGTASYATSNLAVGTDSVQAAYSGDAAYNASSSNAVSITITQAITPIVQLSTTALSFGSEALGYTSASQTVTLTNTGTAALSFSGTYLTGANIGDFSKSTQCAASVPPGGTCSFILRFTPAAAGTRTAILNLSDNAAKSPQQVTLSGTGTSGTSTPIVQLSTTSLSFGSEALGYTSASQTVTLTNAGTAALSFAGTYLTGANIGDFSKSTQCAASVPPGGTCSFILRFTPAATGTRTAILNLSDNAVKSPQQVALSGTGTSGTNTPIVQLSTTSLTFGTDAVGHTSASQTVTLTNIGTVALNFHSSYLTGANVGDFSKSTQCAASVAPGGTCTFTLTFKPTATGNRGATLNLSDNANMSPQQVSLTGTGD